MPYLLEEVHWILLIFSLPAGTNEGNSLLLSQLVIVTICDPLGVAKYDETLMQTIHKLADSPCTVDKIITIPLQTEDDKYLFNFVDLQCPVRLLRGSSYEVLCGGISASNGQSCSLGASTSLVSDGHG
jgi:hypothetical protein